MSEANTVGAKAAKPATVATPAPASPNETDNRAGGTKSATPMMAQYLEIKRANPDCLLFYRMGDFYELFFDDAVKAAGALDITLTKRGKHQGDDIPMCGVPIHAADQYLERLISKGFRVAVCEQTEDPAEAKKRGAKAVVAREVVRLVTPGTLTEDTILDARSHNYLAALAAAGGADELALAWADVSTGEFRVAETSRAGIGADLARLRPGELLVPDKLLTAHGFREFLDELGDRVTPLPSARFDSRAGERRLKSLFAVGALEGFGNYTRAELAAAAAVIDYIELTQKGRLPLIKPPERETPGGTLAIDGATRRNLELTRTLAGDRQGSVLATIDRTLTGAGARLLAARLASPLTDPAAINGRLDAVAWFVDARDLGRQVREALRRTPDIERALGRLTLGRGGPRDLAAVRDGLRQAGEIRRLVASDGGALAMPPSEIAAAATALGDHGPLVDGLDAALAAELPMITRDGGFIAKGYHPPLDEQRTLRDESRRVIATLEGRYREETGIASLKIRHNNVLGYYVEVTATHAEKMMAPPLKENFIHRQTLANQVRFTTVELGELEDKIRSAGDKALALELELWAGLVETVAAAGDRIAAAAGALATIDVAAALAELAVDARYVRPDVDDGLAFRVVGGRHPVVEAALARTGGAPFVPNDCTLNAGDASAEGADREELPRRIWLVTGPNMAGKSTFLRQNALIAILAQMGSFVPADEAHIGVIDRLFSRVGAADDLARGRSTFMVEMVEAAAILNQAGPRALVILDEIGRGTATFDGLSIAWAAVEHLHEVNRCRALFATHYHELTALSEKLSSLTNVTMKVKEWKGDVVFLHEVAPGAADRSYGIQVAKLAGLPSAVIARAQDVLAALEESGHGEKAKALADDLPLFSAARPKGGLAGPGPGGKSAVDEALAAIHPDDLTPRQALEALYRLKGVAEDETD